MSIFINDVKKCREIEERNLKGHKAHLKFLTNKNLPKEEKLPDNYHIKATQENIFKAKIIISILDKLIAGELKEVKK